MAKYTRHDLRNKKRNKHKLESKYGKDKRIKRVDSDTPKLKEIRAQ